MTEDPDGFGWIRMDLDGFEWIWMDSNGSGWMAKIIMIGSSAYVGEPVKVRFSTSALGVCRDRKCSGYGSVAV